MMDKRQDISEQVSRSISRGVHELVEVLGTFLIFLIGGAFTVGTVGNPILCLAAGVWRSRLLIHVGIGWAAIVGFGVGLGAVVLNYLVWVSLYFGLFKGPPVTSENWGVLWIGVIFPYLVAPSAIVVVWKLCNRKEAAIFSLGS